MWPLSSKHIYGMQSAKNAIILCDFWYVYPMIWLFDQRTEERARERERDRYAKRRRRRPRENGNNDNYTNDNDCVCK